MYQQLCSYENLYLAYKKARKRKTLKPYVIEFEENLEDNLLQLRSELLLHSYQPKPLQTFIIRDPKTRKINRSDFRDRVVHHALCNIIEPILEKKFIYDSYANRKGKGTLAAIKRFDHFKRKVSKNFTLIKNSENIKGFVFKADIKQFFDNVDHEILLNIIKRTIKDQKIIWLIKTILANKNTGMPLGNLTSQFFANVYLNELDQFVKHKLKAKYYLRYVDDHAVLHKSKEKLEKYKVKVNNFLNEKLALQLHSDKSRIFPLYRGTNFLGLKIFPYHEIIQKKNIQKFKLKLERLCLQYDQSLTDYDNIYDFLEGWCAYVKNTNSYKLKKKLLSSIEEIFSTEISNKEINQGLKQKGR